MKIEIKLDKSQLATRVDADFPISRVPEGTTIWFHKEEGKFDLPPGNHVSMTVEEGKELIGLPAGKIYQAILALPIVDFAIRIAPRSMLIICGNITDWEISIKAVFEEVFEILMEEK